MRLNCPKSPHVSYSQCSHTDKNTFSAVKRACGFMCVNDSLVISSICQRVVAKLHIFFLEG